MKIGIIGAHYGHIRGMFNSAANAPNGEFVGMVESDATIYERYTEKQAIPRFATLEDMLDKAQPELVLEGLAHNEKVETIETCAAAGAHMLLDKPLCRTREDWQRIRAAVGTHNIKLSTFFTSCGYIKLDGNVTHDPCVISGTKSPLHNSN